MKQLKPFKLLLPILLFGTVWLWSAAVSYFPQPQKGTVAELPATCVVGQEYFATNATAGQNKYFCTATNTWTQQLNSGGGGGAGITRTVVSYSATPTFIRSSQIQIWEITLTGNVTSSTTSGVTAGDILVFEICEDSSGAHSFVWPTGFSTAAAISTTLSTCTSETFYWNGSSAVNITGGVSTDPADAPITVLSGDVSTPGSGSGVSTIGAAKVAPSMMKASTFDAQTDGATITWNMASVKDAFATVTLGGNRTLNISNPVIGGNYIFKITQDGTGSRTLSLGTGCTWKVAAGGSGAITLSASAGAVDVLAFTYDGTNCYANLGKNYN